MSTTRLKSLSTFPIGLKGDLRKAVEHYGFGSFNAFFQAAALALVEHCKRGETLIMPLRFNNNSKAKRHHEMEMD
jgi:hypothetical protein